MGELLEIHGASGGLGVSTLAVAVALALARTGSTVCLVDGVVSAGGIDVTACIEHLGGIRWDDLVGARGEVDGEALLTDLPAVEGVPVLSARGEAGAPSDAVIRAVLAGLRSARDVLVVDAGVGRSPASDDRRVSVLLARTTARGVADALAARSRWPDGPGPSLLVRGDPDLSEALADHLDLPLIGSWPDDARVAGEARRAIAPGAGRSRVSSVADRVLTATLSSARGATWLGAGRPGHAVDR